MSYSVKVCILSSSTESSQVIPHDKQLSRESRLDHCTRVDPSTYKAPPLVYYAAIAQPTAGSTPN